jgi:serine/threonine protein kinase
MKTDFNTGRLLANRYQLMDLVGKGAMGQVYQAKDMLLGGVIVAVKFLSQSLLNKKMRDRFEREATICALLGEKSIHIVRVRDYGVDENDTPFYVMEFLQGEGLSDIIRPQALSLPRFLSLSRQISLGLECAHKGIVMDGATCPIIHRDIKPSNILVVQDPSFGELAKILDFGIAKLLQEDSAQTHSFMGTLAYCSPEQMEGKELDKRSDIYSLGIMMFEMLTGEMPITAETHSFGGWYKAHHYNPPRTFESVDPALKKLPKSLESLVMSCLAKAPQDRPQSATDVLKALEPLEQQLNQGRQIGLRTSSTFSKSNLPVPVEREPKYRTHLRSQSGAASRLSISLTKQRLILVVA